MRIRSIDLAHGRFFARLPIFLDLKPTLARLVSQPLPSFPMHKEENDSWILFTHPLGAEDAATPTSPIPKGAQRMLHTTGKAGRERGWRRTGTDKLASYGLETEVWIRQISTIPDTNIIALEALLQTKSEKNLLDMRSEGVEPIYWARNQA